MQSAHSDTDWRTIAEEFYNTTKSIRSIAAGNGVSEAAIRKRARQHGWRRPSAVSTNRPVPALAAALEVQLASVDSVVERSRRFVAAMIQLGAGAGDIAEALSVSERSLLVEFRGEFESHTGMRFPG